MDGSVLAGEEGDRSPARGDVSDPFHAVCRFPRDREVCDLAMKRDRLDLTVQR